MDESTPVYSEIIRVNGHELTLLVSLMNDCYWGQLTCNDSGRVFAGSIVKSTLQEATHATREFADKLYSKQPPRDDQAAAA